MSKTTVVYPMITALVKAEEIIGPQRQWEAVNEQQRQFLRDFFQPARQESASLEEIESIAAFSAEEINHFLRERGFQIQLRPFQTSGKRKEFGIASVLNLLVRWLEPGQERTLTGPDQRPYPAVRLPKKVSSFYQSARHKHPIVQLKTQSSDVVYLTKLEDALADFELFQYAQALSRALEPTSAYNGVIFPMVDLKQEEDVSWLSDLHTPDREGRESKVAQALQETHLAMNEVGAHAESAFAGTVMLTMAYRRSEPDLVIDEPFLIWFERPGLSKPLFVGRITEEDWKNPGSL